MAIRLLMAFEETDSRGNSKEEQEWAHSQSFSRPSAHSDSKKNNSYSSSAGIEKDEVATCSVGGALPRSDGTAALLFFLPYVISVQQSASKDERLTARWHYHGNTQCLNLFGKHLRIPLHIDTLCLAGVPLSLTYPRICRCVYRPPRPRRSKPNYQGPPEIKSLRSAMTCNEMARFRAKLLRSMPYQLMTCATQVSHSQPPRLPAGKVCVLLEGMLEYNEGA